VLLDGRDLRKLQLTSLRSQISMVMQESVLFHLSFRDNIRLGNLQATDAEIESSAREAELHEFIQTLPRGYDTNVGECGCQLSGGQRQRLALARAIVRDPAILVLDEATAALDHATERAIHRTLLHLRKNRTVISVTHRLSTVVEADMIYVLDQGRIVESGRHEQLLAAGGKYAQLWQARPIPRSFGTNPSSESTDNDQEPIASSPRVSGLG
jgi:ATP-binding cassette subfamily B protein